MAYDEELAARLREHLLGEPGLSEQTMFGGLAFLVNGNMAVAASGTGGLLLRVPPDRTEELLAEPQAAPFEMGKREMRGWLRVDPGPDLGRWADIGVSYARSLPPK
jgi:TfoX N-terminal domain